MAFPKREKYLLILVLVCVGLFLGDRVVFTPLGGLWKARSERIAELRGKLDKADTLIGREEAMRRRWNEMLDLSLLTNPAEAEDSVFSAVNQWSRSSGLTITSLTPRWIEDRDKRHSELEIRASGRGNLASIVRFLYEAEKSVLPVRLSEVELASRDDRGGDLTVSARFSCVILNERANQ